jgi:cystathionine beta-lyase/cystathionine gamma-synthase
VRQQNDSAQRIARFLDEHAGVERVHHPSLPRHRHHARARALCTGFGGVVSFEPRGDGARVIERLTIPLKTASLGGVETLVTRPSRTSHAGLSPEERRALGIGDALIRLSVGLESVDDLIEDLDRALA